MNKVLYIFCLVILIFLACQKEIKLDFNEAHTSTLFVEGMLYPGQAPRIYLSNSNPFFSQKVSPQDVFARGATVKIVSGGTSETLLADSTFNKFRCRWEPYYQGKIRSLYGATYTLEINYQGKSYTASTTISQQKVNIDSLVYTPEFFDVYGSHDGMYVHLTDHPGTQEYYRFQMNRIIDTGTHHAHVLDRFVNTCVKKDEEFPVKDIGRIVFSDESANGKNMILPIEVTFEYDKGDEGWVFIQSLDQNAAAFYKDLDDQLQSIQNPFVEPVFIKTKIPGAVGVFGSAVLSDSVLFVYPRDHP